MAGRIALKDDYAENRLTRVRSFIAVAVILGLLVFLASRLYFLQIANHDHYSTLSLNNRVRLTAEPPTRGLIFDRNGVILANNLPTYRLEIIPEEVDDMDQVLAELQTIIAVSPYDLTRFKRALKRKHPFEGVPLRFNMTDDEVAQFAVNRHRFPGVDIEARLTRNYPLGGQAVHALGYVGRIDDADLKKLDAANYSGTSHIGKLGIEKFYEEDLHGLVGHRQVEVNAEGRVLRVLQNAPSVAGNNLVLTLDAGLQAVAEQAFAGQKGALVAMMPKTGEVLAMVSQPTYDPNLFVKGITTKAYSALRNSRSRPLFNRALSGQYPPGSTTKPMIGLAALEHAVVRPQSTVKCVGHYKLPNEEDRLYRDWKKEGHGVVNLNKAIQRSCDVYFYDTSYHLGIDRMHTFLEQFGFGRLTGIDNTSERPGLLPSREWKKRTRGVRWFPGETLITGIGQGAFSVTPLQLASATATVATKGVRVKPRLLKAMRHTATQETLDVATEVVEQMELKNESHWEQIFRGMRNVVHTERGTAHHLSWDAKYTFAGKSGTAQVFGIAQDEEYEEEKIAKKLRDHALFVAFAPLDDPQIAVAVIVENGGSGGQVAGPIVRAVMDEFLLQNDIVKERVK